MLSDIIKKIKTAPKDPGVYIFLKKNAPLYIGKASNLKNRLQSYLKITDFKTEALHREANNLKILRLGSNIEALITESQLIKNLKPAYNILWRDDKNYFYVAVTKDKFPRIFLSHQLNEYPSANYIGPFTEGRAIKVILRLLRKFFPYCAHNPHFRICLDAQINNCPGYCCQKPTIPTPSGRDSDRSVGANNRQLIKDYGKNIIKIKNILTGKNKRFIHQLKDPYELLILEKIWAHEPYLTDPKLQILSKSTNKSLLKSSKKFVDSYAFVALDRVECYDNSHLSGKEAVGAMTAWKKEGGAWIANKDMWRKFKIRGNYTEDDPRMMEEIVSRRLNHPEWPYPDLIIIDGGITQLNAARRALQKRIMNNELGIMDKNKSLIHDSKFIIPKIVSFAKPEQLVYGLSEKPVTLSKLPEEFQKLIGMAIQNTHNFAIRYHRQVRRRAIINLWDSSRD